MSRLAQQERGALCDTMLAAGPDAPTLCGTWTTADLAAHLAIRESPRIDLAAGIVVPVLAGRTDAATRSLAARTPFAELVERVRTGPPAWHPTRVSRVDEAANLVEMYIHHEDVRRGGSDANPRRLPQELTTALGKQLAKMAPLLLRRAKGVDVELVTARHRKRVGSGHPVVEVHGHPGEILLYLSGRKGVAQVEFVGERAAVAALAESDLGM